MNGVRSDAQRADQHPVTDEAISHLSPGHYEPINPTAGSNRRRHRHQTATARAAPRLKRQVQPGVPTTSLRQPTVSVSRRPVSRRLTRRRWARPARTSGLVRRIGNPDAD